MRASNTSSYGNPVWGRRAVARISRPSGKFHRSAAINRRAPKGRKIGGIQGEKSAGIALHQSIGQEGRTTRVSATQAATAMAVFRDGQPTQSATELLGWTTRRKASTGTRLAATMSGVVSPYHKAKRYAPDKSASSPYC